MQLSRRHALQLLASAAPALALRNTFGQSPSQTTGQSPLTPPLSITPGPFTNTKASLRAYTTPDWFADAKFGIWAHWGPQSAVGDGDWYARNMYIEGTPQYEYHRKRFGPQSKVGYKDLVHLFTADQWDPEHLMDLYQKAGAKYFFSMGVHHDGFDLWNSRYQPRWNAVAKGPHKDVVGIWAAAARKRGLRFGVSEHLSNAFDWLAPSHLADTKGQYAGTPYDGQNPAFADLYHDYSGMPANFAQSIKDDPMGRKAPDWWKLQYFNRVKDLLDQHQPDLLYTDGGIEFGEYGLGTVAELYNVGPYSYQHKSEAIYFSKTPTDCPDGTSCVIDHERNVLNQIDPIPWQTDTCIGDWHYKLGIKYKSPKKVIDMLVDIVSKNGNLLLNVVLRPDGSLDPEVETMLHQLADWRSVNGEAIFGTRPWLVYGEGEVKAKGGAFKENFHYSAKDIRFTTKGPTLYAIALGWPEDSQITIRSLALTDDPAQNHIKRITLLGHRGKLKFTQTRDGLVVQLPSEKLSDLTCSLKINGTDLKPASLAE